MLGNLKRNASGAYLETQGSNDIHGGHSGGPVLNSRGEVVGWVMRKLEAGGTDGIDEFRPVETPDPKYYDTPMQSFWGALAAATSDVDVARQDWRDTVALRRRLDTTIVPLDEKDRVGEQAEGRRTKEAAAAAAAAATTAAATAAAMAAAVEAQRDTAGAASHRSATNTGGGIRDAAAARIGQGGSTGAPSAVAAAARRCRRQGGAGRSMGSTRRKAEGPRRRRRRAHREARKGETASISPSRRPQNGWPANSRP